jgi:hypothetical protein
MIAVLAPPARAAMAARMREIVQARPEIPSEFLARFSKNVSLDAIEALAEVQGAHRQAHSDIGTWPAR